MVKIKDWKLWFWVTMALRALAVLIIIGLLVWGGVNVFDLIQQGFSGADAAVSASSNAGAGFGGG